MEFRFENSLPSPTRDHPRVAIHPTEERGHPKDEIGMKPNFTNSHFRNGNAQVMCTLTDGLHTIGFTIFLSFCALSSLPSSLLSNLTK